MVIEIERISENDFILLLESMLTTLRVSINVIFVLNALVLSVSHSYVLLRIDDRITRRCKIKET